MAGKINIMDLINQRVKEVQVPKEDTTDKMELMYLDIYDLIPSKDNFYHVDTGLKDSIEAMGILQPLLVKKKNKTEYTIIAGHNRQLACKTLVEEGKNEYRYVPCVLKKENTLDRLRLIAANKYREKTDWERMKEAVETEKIVAELKKEYDIPGRTCEILSNITGISVSQMSRFRAINNNLNPILMSEFKAGRIGFAVAAKLCSLPQEWQEQAVEKYTTQEILTVSDADELKEFYELSKVEKEIVREEIGKEENRKDDKGNTQKTEQMKANEYKAKNTEEELAEGLEEEPIGQQEEKEQFIIIKENKKEGCALCSYNQEISTQQGNVIITFDNEKKIFKICYKTTGEIETIIFKHCPLCGRKI